MSEAQDRFFPRASGPVNTHPGPDFPSPQQPGKEKEAEADEDESEARARTEGRIMSEPGTNEWAYETGNYMDPEPDWNAGSPYVDHAHGVVFYDEASEVEAGRERWPSYRHVGPESEPEPEPETEAGLWRSSPWRNGTG